MKKFDTLFFIGPQGSGKGTQAKLLASKLGLFYFEMGAILRQEAKQPTEFGKVIADMINKGLLLHDEALYKVFIDEIEKLPKTEGILFDGVPRTLPQAEFVLKYLQQKGRNSFATVFLDLPVEESIKRLLLRAHHEYRADDTESTIRKRLELYQKETLPVVDFLKTRTEFFWIDGKPSIEEVTKAIDAALEIS